MVMCLTELVDPPFPLLITKNLVDKKSSFFGCLFFQFVYVHRLSICKVFISFTRSSTSQRGRLCYNGYGFPFEVAP